MKTHIRLTLSSSGGYFAAQLVLMLAGLVSLPIMTRLLTKEEYGRLNLVLASVAILVLVGQLGFPQATTRFFSEREREGGRRLREFCSDMVLGTVGSGILVGLAMFAVLRWRGEDDSGGCMQLAALIVVSRATLNVILQLYRAQERVGAFAAAQLFNRYGTLALAVALLVFHRATARDVVLATVLGEGLVVAACLLDLVRRGVLGMPHVSWSTLRAASTYGIPLAIGSSASFILDYGDRFLIERFLGLNAVAAYAVPYDLVQNLAGGLLTPVRLAVIPIVFRLWAAEGQVATSQFVSEILTYVTAFALPVAVLFCLLSRDVIVLLASARYASSALLVPLLLPGVFIGEMNFLVASGLTIQKRTKVLAAILIGAGMLNLGLNALLLPLMGLSGAAVATTVSYLALALATFALSRSALEIRPAFSLLLKVAIATAVMVACVTETGPLSSRLAVSLLVRGLLGCAVVAAVMALLDRKVRDWTWMRLPQVSR